MSASDRRRRLVWPTIIVTNLLITQMSSAASAEVAAASIHQEQQAHQHQEQQPHRTMLFINAKMEDSNRRLLDVELSSPASSSSSATNSTGQQQQQEQQTQPMMMMMTTTTTSTSTSSNNSSNKTVLELSAFDAAALGYFRHSTGTSVILAIAYSFVFVIGIVGNSFVVAIVCKSPRMRTVTNYFIANLAVADILVLLFCLPATLISNLFIPYVLGLFVCKTVSYLQGVAVSASINTMVTVTMDRFLAICFPMDWHMSRRTARWVIACIWLFSLSISAPWAVFFTLTPYEMGDTNIQVCKEEWPSEYWSNIYFVFANLILLYLLPGIVIILCYLGIWYKIERRNIPGDRPNGLKIELIMQKSKLKVVKMMMVVVAMFLMSWLPVYLIVTRIKLGPEEKSPWEDWLITHMMPLAQWLGASNSCINPILYTFFNRKYKRDFMDLLRFAFCCDPLWLRQQRRRNHHHHHLNNHHNHHHQPHLAQLHQQATFPGLGAPSQSRLTANGNSQLALTSYSSAARSNSNNTNNNNNNSNNNSTIQTEQLNSNCTANHKDGGGGGADDDDDNHHHHHHRQQLKQNHKHNHRKRQRAGAPTQFKAPPEGTSRRNHSHTQPAGEGRPTVRHYVNQRRPHNNGRRKLSLGDANGLDWSVRPASGQQALALGNNKRAIQWKPQQPPQPHQQANGRAVSLQTLHKPVGAATTAMATVTATRPNSVQLVLTGSAKRPFRRPDEARPPPPAGRRRMSAGPISDTDERRNYEQQSIDYVDEPEVQRGRRDGQSQPQQLQTQDELETARELRLKQRRRRRRRRRRAEAAGDGSLIRHRNSAQDKLKGNIEMQQQQQQQQQQSGEGKPAGHQSNSSGSMRSSSKSSKWPSRERARPPAPLTSSNSVDHTNKETIKSNYTTDSTETTALSLTTTTTTTTNGQSQSQSHSQSQGHSNQNNHSVTANSNSNNNNNNNNNNGRPGQLLEYQSAGMTDNDEADELDQAEVEFQHLQGLESDAEVSEEDEFDDDNDDDDDDDDDLEDEDDDGQLSEESSYEYSESEVDELDDDEPDDDDDDDDDDFLFGSPDERSGPDGGGGDSSLVQLAMRKLNEPSSGKINDKKSLHEPAALNGRQASLT